MRFSTRWRSRLPPSDRPSSSTRWRSRLPWPIHFGATALSIVSALTLFALRADASGAAQRPNIILILTDDLGYGDLGEFWQNARKAAGNPREPWHATPQLDTMAREGVQLRQHYCPAPVCAPSRASLLLGVHQGHANIRDNLFDRELENNHTIATVLKQGGYATAAIGKWGLQGAGHNPLEWPAYPTKRGFDYYFGYVRHRDGHEHYPKEGLYRGVKECYDGTQNITPVLDKCYTTDLFTARAKKWIVDQHATDAARPFFLYLAFDTPHAVLELPTQAYPSGGGIRGGLQWTGIPGRMINTASGEIDSYVHPDYAAATWHDGKNAAAPWPEVNQRYATSVRRIDDCVGDLLQLLRDLGIDDNTLVVFSSDNGPSRESYLPAEMHPDFFDSFGPFEGIKRDVWEGGVRVPTLARWPGRIPAGRVDQTPSGLWDWLATFADAAGLPIPARSDGVSLIPAMSGSGEQRPSNVYIEYFFPGTTPEYEEFSPQRRGRKQHQMQAVRIGNYMGVRYDVGSAGDDFEIYDVVSDPKERLDLWRQAATQDRAVAPPTGDALGIGALQQQMKERVLQSRRPSPVAARPYDHAAVPSLAIAATRPGLEWRAYTAAFPWLPELSLLNPASRGTNEALTLDIRPREENFGLLFTGYLQVPTSGEYSFVLSTDARALVRLHAATLLDADFGYGYAQPSEISAAILLEAGLHPIRIYYARQAGDKPRLDLSWSGPGFERQPVPASAFFRSDADRP